MSKVRQFPSYVVSATLTFRDVYRQKRLVACALVIAISFTLTAAAQNINAPPNAQTITQSAGTYDELKQLLMTRYDGKTVVAGVSGLYAGEQEKGHFFGPGQNGAYWSHYVPELKLNMKKAADMHQLDDRTFGMITRGLNVSPIAKGEALKVYKFYLDSDDVQFVLTTTNIEHLRDLDVNKASQRVTTTVRGNQVNQRVTVGGFGLVFTFHFEKDALKKDHDYAAVLREIDKYLLPQSEAKELAATQNNIEIEPGMTEEQVTQKLGQPLQAIKFGDQQTLKYNGMTIVLKEGKVVDLKIE